MLADFCITYTACFNGYVIIQLYVLEPYSCHYKPRLVFFNPFFVKAIYLVKLVLEIYAFINGIQERVVMARVGLVYKFKKILLLIAKY